MMTKRILAIIGSPRKKETWHTVRQFENDLKQQFDAEFEYIFLRECNLQQCRGCFLCLTKGDEFCPHKDDREMLVNKILASDGVVFATPNYSLQVTAIMKNFLDRIAYTFHRPCFFGIRFMAIVTQGAIGGEGILRYFRDVARYTGFIHVNGVCVTTVTPRPVDEQALIDRKVAAGAKRFSRALAGCGAPTPSLFMVAMFRIVRAMYRTTPDDTLKDVRYYRGNGWFTAPYFYPVKLGVAGQVVGALVDALGKSFALKRKKGLAAIAGNGHTA